MSESDRMARAGDYVLGLMDDAARERAERDMEMDAEFRDCVARLAVRLSPLDRTAAGERAPDGPWQAVETRIADMPQMQGTPVPAAREDAALERQTAEIVDAKKRIDAGRSAAHSVGGWRGWLIAAALVAACALGYVGGRMTMEPPAPPAESGSLRP